MNQAILSDLSPTEFITLTRLGLYPRGVVMGVSVRDTGYNDQMVVYTTTSELPQLSYEMHFARHQALEQMRAEAATLGAEGVVGVRLQIDISRWCGGQFVARFVAMGTAVAFDPARAAPEIQGSPSLRLSDGPFTSDLSAHDLASLLRAGMRPATLALGNSVWQLAGGLFNGLTLGNVELPDYTRAFAEAREIAMENLLGDLTLRQRQGATEHPIGIVGMTVEEGPLSTSKNLLEFSAVGTSILPADPADPRVSPALPAPALVIPLDG